MSLTVYGVGRVKGKRCREGISVLVGGSIDRLWVKGDPIIPLTVDADPK